MPATKKTAPKPLQPADPNTKWHFLIWTMVVLILLTSIMIYKRLALIQFFNSLSEDQTAITSQSGQKDLAKLTASLRLDLNQATPSALQVGQTYRADVVVNTSDQLVVGTDAYLNYDPKAIQVTAVQKGSIFPSYPSAQYSSSNGKITISGISPPGQDFIGEGVLATISFRPLKPGPTNIDFVFTPLDTRDSNVVALESAGDILGTVLNLLLTIE